MLLLNTLPALVPMNLPAWFDPATLIHGLGNWALWGVCAILFIECAIFPVLPGDSLLFTVGMFVAMSPPSITLGGLNKPMTALVACVLMALFAVAGNLAGYQVGKFLSPWLFKPRAGLIGRIFSVKHLEQSRLFFDRYGSRALVMARFVPFVRTFITMVAGASRMNLRHFMVWTAIGGVAWAWGVALLGYFLGRVQFIGDNIDAVLIAIVAVSLVPMVVEYLAARRRKARQAD